MKQTAGKGFTDSFGAQLPTAEPQPIRRTPVGGVEPDSSRPNSVVRLNRVKPVRKSKAR